MSKLRVLIGCEFSGIVRSAFRKRGHDAWSCDILPSEDNSLYHYKCDVLDVLDYGWDLAVFHPPCFSGDTLVLTQNGYKEISRILIGEYVLTHEGRWKQVTDVQSRFVSQTLTVNITGSLPIITTNEHPFLTKFKKLKWNNDIRRYERIVSDYQWIEAQYLNRGHLVGSVLPPEEPEVPIDDEHLWLMGLYVADGYLRFRNNKFEQVTFCLGQNKAKEFKQKILRKNKEYLVKSVSKFNMYGSKFCASFAQFGQNCETKQLPGWILSLPHRQAKIFLEGYLFGDGHFVKKTKLIKASSVSKKLSCGIALLLRRVFNKPSSIRFAKSRGPINIEGRIVNQLDSYPVQCNTESSKLKSIIDKNYTWYEFKNSNQSDGCMVYNLSVDEDESYIVNQAIVHNCTYLTNAGVRHLHSVKSKNGVLPKIHGKARWQAMKDAAYFFLKLYSCSIPKICIENPVPHKYAKAIIGQYTQLIQPWHFGEKQSKAICLWLKGLPKLIPTDTVGPPPRKMTPEEKRSWHKVHYMSPGKDRWKERSRFFPSIAREMANQWS